MIDNNGIRPLTCPPDLLTERYEGNTRDVPEHVLDVRNKHWVVNADLKLK